MNDFEDKLNAILSNPDAMAQVMNLAQSLGSTMSPSQQSQQSEGTPSEPPPMSANAGEDLFSLLDPALIGKFLPLLSELNRSDGDQRLQLLLALKPFLKPERRDKVERAVKAARLIHIGKKFFMTMGDTNV